MKSVRARPGRLVPILLILAGMALGRYFGVGGGQPSVDPREPDLPTGRTSAAAVLDLDVVTDVEHRRQIMRVVAAMDRAGSPPEGVTQGGRRGGQRGAFQNAEGRLPRKGAGYWIESDVWPKNGPRDAERLIFGREREVYWTRDHYETFARLR